MTADPNQPSLPFNTGDGEAAEFFQMPGALVRCGFLPRLSGAAWKTYIALRFHRNRQTGLAWPGIECLKGKTGLNPKSVSRALKELEVAGLIARTSAPHRNRATRWSFPALNGCAGATNSGLVAPARKERSRPVAPARQLVAPARTEPEEEPEEKTGTAKQRRADASGDGRGGELGQTAEPGKDAGNGWIRYRATPDRGGKFPQVELASLSGIFMFYGAATSSPKVVLIGEHDRLGRWAQGVGLTWASHLRCLVWKYGEFSQEIHHEFMVLPMGLGEARKRAVRQLVKDHQPECNLARWRCAARQ